MGVVTACVFAALGLVLLSLEPSSAEISPWTYACVNGRCNKQAANTTPSQSLAVCKMLCDEYAALWPRPSGGVQVSHVLAEVDVNNITVRVPHDKPSKIDKLVDGLQNYARNIVISLHRSDTSRTDDIISKRPLEIVLHIADTSIIRPAMNVDEAYELRVTTRIDEGGVIMAEVTAATFFGARHGVETLLQLIVYSDLDQKTVIPSEVAVSDSPKYTHRGFLLDTSRNYFSVESIKRTIDAMASVKLNTFHWHITDSHSFPLVAGSRPQLHTLGAYTPDKIYTPEAVKDIVEYARVRGVRVIPEFDAPAHVGEGWQFGEQDNMTVCFRAEPWSSYCVEPPCGQLNPLSDKMYEVLSDIYTDMLALFDSDVFHMGGDEVNLNCWNTSEAVLDKMSLYGYGRSESELLRLWSDFQQRALDLLTRANNNQRPPAILWTSHLTEKGQVDRYLDSGNYIIQIWTTGQDEVIGELMRKGYRVILSNYDALYFDCGYGSWVAEGNNWCSPYIGWQKTYENRPRDILSQQNVSEHLELVLGGEAALWSEQVDEQALDGKVWPRLGALAERLWSDPDENWREAEMRMIHLRERLVKRGVMADSLQPEWCHQNEDKCKI